MSVDSMTRHMSPVNPAVYPHLTLVLLTIGIFFTAWFFVYEVTSTKITRDIFKVNINVCAQETEYIIFK